MASFDRKNEQAVFPFSSLRVLPYQIFSGPFNMALDFSLSQNIGDNDSPILRFYGWQPYCLSLGYHQDTALVNFDRLAKDGYQVVRRPTGGSAIFHSEELTYALIVPGGNLWHHHIYQMFHTLLVKALNTLGYEVKLNTEADKENYIKKSKKRFACFNRPALSEIKFAGKKVVGSAQKLYHHALLQHGSILLGSKQKAIVEFLKLKPAEKEKYRLNLEESSIALNEINRRRISPLQICEALLSQFESIPSLTIHYDSLSAEEIKEAQKFVDRFKIQ